MLLKYNKNVLWKSSLCSESFRRHIYLHYNWCYPLDHEEVSILSRFSRSTLNKQTFPWGKYFAQTIEPWKSLSFLFLISRFMSIVWFLSRFFVLLLLTGLLLVLSSFLPFFLLVYVLLFLLLVLFIHHFEYLLGLLWNFVSLFVYLLYCRIPIFFNNIFFLFLKMARLNVNKTGFVNLEFKS